MQSLSDQTSLLVRHIVNFCWHGDSCAMDVLMERQFPAGSRHISPLSLLGQSPGPHAVQAFLYFITKMLLDMCY